MFNNAGKGNVSIHFNLCDFTKRTCPDGFADFANVINENNTCSHMSSNKLSDVVVALIDVEDPELGLSLTF